MHYVLEQDTGTGSTQEDPSWCDWKIIDLDVKNQTNKLITQSIPVNLKYSVIKELHCLYNTIILAQIQNSGPISPVENKNDLELDFKVFLFADSCCADIVDDESNWCHSGIIERFEKLKMASKMAVSYAPNTYLTNRFDKKSSNFDFFMDV